MNFLLDLQNKFSMYQRTKEYYLDLFFSNNIKNSFYSNAKETKLGEILSLQGGFNFNSNKFNANGENMVIKIGDIPNNLDLDKFKGNLSEENCNKKYMVSKGDIIIALSGATFGKSGLVKGSKEAFINQRVAKFKCKNCDTNFIYQLINSPNFKKYLNSIPTSSAQPNISNKDILSYNSLIPELNEQKKIGHFLSLLDKKINFIIEEQRDLVDFKNGLLQQMFI